MRSGSDSQTANQLVPESNQTSRMSVSLRKAVPPQCAHFVPAGSRSAMGVVCQASAPSRSKRSTILRLSAASMMGWLQPSHMKTAMGTPQMRWRLMHQSGRVAIMLVMRSLPQAGIPDDLVDLFDGKLAECGFGAVGALHRGFERDEPLLGGAEDDGVVAAPAVRIGVLEVGDGQQCAALFKHGDDDGIGGPDFLAFEGRERGVRPRGRDRRECGRRHRRGRSGRGRSAGRCRSRLRRGRARCGRRRCPVSAVT